MAITLHQKQRFIEKMAQGSSVSGAARAAGINPSSAYVQRERDPEFAAAWVEAYERGTDGWEDECARRAFRGTDKPVWHKGQLVGWERQYSDGLAQFMLKGRRPHKYVEYGSATPGGDFRPPVTGGEDVLAILEQRLAGIESRRLAFGRPKANSE